MPTPEQKLNLVWSYAFAHTMRERESIPGDASSPKRRFEVAVRDADEAVATPKALEAWWRSMQDEES